MEAPPLYNPHYEETSFSSTIFFPMLSTWLHLLTVFFLRETVITTQCDTVSHHRILFLLLFLLLIFLIIIMLDDYTFFGYEGS